MSSTGFIFSGLKLICGLAWALIFYFDYRKTRERKPLYVMFVGVSFFVSGCIDFFKLLCKI